ncbi:MAG: UDP-2,3-diacylglucosamine diphosphatase [Melioribacteraceae bacterium]|nr:UDP-2,3-diacylglucosamine diphosphatase [Melioribacteraceae bacterium]
MEKVYVFISDLHLGLLDEDTERQREKKVVDFLKEAKKVSDELFIIGDLFDYWFEYKRVMQKGFIRTLAALADYADEGNQIHYFIGNHDFMHRDFFEKEIGAKLYHDPIDIVLNDKRFFIGHGDGLVKNDYGYIFLKSILRNKFFQKLYSFVHPNLGIRIASSSSKTSRKYTAKKNYGTIDGLLETAKEKIDEGFDYVLLGHSHSRENLNYKNGTYINLGTWLDKPCYGKFVETFEIIEWN